MCKRFLMCLLATLSALTQAGATLKLERVGQLADVRGTVCVLRGPNRSAKLARAFTGFQVLDGDVVIARRGSQAVTVLYGNGARYRIAAPATGDSKARVVAHEPNNSSLQWVKVGRKPMLIGRFPAVPQIRRLIAGSGGVRAMGRGVDRLAVPGENLRLLWKPFPGALQAKVHVRVNGRPPESWKSEGAKLLPGAMSSYTLPGGDIPVGAKVEIVVHGLPGGTAPLEQSWQVTALGAEELDGLQRLRRQVKEEAGAGYSDVSAHVLLAKVYVRCNRLEEALSLGRDCRRVIPADAGILCMMRTVLVELDRDHPEKPDYAQELGRIQALHTKSRAAGHVCDEADDMAE